VRAIKFEQFELAIALCALAANAVAASPIWVSNTNDAGKNSLRAAITKANKVGGGEIRFCITNTITLASPLPSLTNITITGPGTNLLTVSGNDQYQVFCMNSGTTNILSGLTIANGMVSNFYDSPYQLLGAGISNAGSLKLLDCAIRGCTNRLVYTISPVGGGIYNSGDLFMKHSGVTDCAVWSGVWWYPGGSGGGIVNEGDLRMEDCTVSGCLGYWGGGIWNSANLLLTNCIIESCSSPYPDSDGGGILSWGNLTIHSCTISNCSSDYGGGIESWGSLAITNSAIVDNGAIFAGGLELGGTNVMVGCTISGNWHGGGIVNVDGVLSMFNCTVSGNGDVFEVAGGIYNGPSAYLGGNTNATIYMNHCTLAFNTNQYGGDGVANRGVFYSQDSIFTGNGTNDFAGVFTSQGYNLIQNTNGCTIGGDETGSIYGADPLLGPLQDNGGPTWTHALLPGSPAIDAGSSGDTLAVDQRGIHRPQGLAPDIGAFEFQYATPVLVRMAVQSCTNSCLKLCGLGGGSYTLQASTNLVNWFNVATNITDTNGVCEFTERGAARCSPRFYRALLPGP